MFPRPRPTFSPRLISTSGCCTPYIGVFFFVIVHAIHIMGFILSSVCLSPDEKGVGGLRGDFNVLMIRNKNIVGRFISKQVLLFVNLIFKKYFRFKNKAPLHKYALNKFSRQQDFYTLAEVGTSSFER